jgi:hypothetical protein
VRDNQSFPLIPYSQVQNIKYLITLDGYEKRIFEGNLTQEEIDQLQEGYIEVEAINELEPISKEQLFS